MLDVPAPLFSALDQLLLTVLPATARLVVWAFVASVVTMFLFAVTSPQRRLKALKQSASQAQLQLLRHDGAFRQIAPLLGRSLQLSSKIIAYNLAPLLVASLPLLSLLSWLDGSYGYHRPEPGSRIALRVIGDDGASEPAAGQTWSITWPAPPTPLTVTSPDGELLARFTAETMTTVIHKRRWWNVFIGNPFGYLPDDSDVAQIEFPFAPVRYLGIGPSWLQTWDAIFVACLVAFSILLRYMFRIH